MMDETKPCDDESATARTRAVIQRYHESWKQREIDAVMALYHPDIEYNDFFQNRTLHLGELRAYVLATMAGRPEERLEHVDRIRVDGDTAFIQYRTTIQGGDGLVSFRSSEAITVRDAKVWRVNEYASLVRGERPTPAPATRSAMGKLGLSARQLGALAQDLQSYFQNQHPFLDPDLSLPQVAEATGYSRNQISYLLNQILGQSFYRYVNQARLEYLMARLEKMDDVRSVDDLAAEAGFNSLSAFYNSFRRHTGMTPRAYLRDLSLRTRVEDSVGIGR
ncbi:helix-turn-helix domain-containing protein [Pseudomonas sp. Marseille-QA0892]